MLEVNSITAVHQVLPSKIPSLYSLWEPKDKSHNWSHMMLFFLSCLTSHGLSSSRSDHPWSVSQFNTQIKSRETGRQQGSLLSTYIEDCVCFSGQIPVDGELPCVLVDGEQTSHPLVNNVVSHCAVRALHRQEMYTKQILTNMHACICGKIYHVLKS